MEATNISRDVHELFHGKPVDNQRIYPKIRERKEKQIKNLLKPTWAPHYSAQTSGF